MPNEFDENGNFTRPNPNPMSSQLSPETQAHMKGIIGALIRRDFGVEADPARHGDAFLVFGAPPPMATATGMQIMAEMAARRSPSRLFQQFSKGMTFNPPTPYDGPDMNEVDAALEAIERMEE